MADRKPYALDGEVVWPDLPVRPEEVKQIAIGRATLNGEDLGAVTMVSTSPAPTDKDAE
jgi:hypothetical protein